MTHIAVLDGPARVLSALRTPTGAGGLVTWANDLFSPAAPRRGSPGADARTALRTGTGPCADP